MLQSLIGGLGAGFALPFVAEAHPIRADLNDQTKVARADREASGPDYKPVFLDAHQFETLDVLAERIVPGSRSARVAPFLDSLLSVSAPENQRRFLGSLGAFEMLAFERRRKPWKELTATEQDELLTYASTAPPLKEADGSGAPGLESNPAIRDFFNDLRSWISGAYYSSEIGMRELGWTGKIFFDTLPSCL